MGEFYMHSSRNNDRDTASRMKELRTLWNVVKTDNFQHSANIEEELEHYSSSPLLAAQARLTVLAGKATEAEGDHFARLFLDLYDVICKQLRLSSRAIELLREYRCQPVP
jgi:hypothetical protein